MQLENIIEDCSLIKAPLQINKKYYEKFMKERDNLKLQWKDDDCFWLDLKAKEKDDNGNVKDVKHGRVRVQMEIVPAEHASKNPVGAARNSPN
jgi:hypothetical protein